MDGGAGHAAVDTQSFFGVFYDGKRREFRARIHYGGQERYIGRWADDPAALGEPAQFPHVVPAHAVQQPCQ